MPLPSRQTVRAGLFLLFVLTLVCLPFAVFGEEFVLPLLKTREQQVGALTVIAVALLAVDSVAPVPATLVSVKQGVPMSERYCCYSALLALPVGLDLPQVSCPVDADGAAWPLLLLTPLGPGADGRHLMQMVFHTLVPQAPSATPAGA